jgi:hypothetical protein
MKNNLFKFLFLTIVGALALTRFYASGQGGQRQTAAPGPPSLSDILKMNGKHSAPPPLTEFGQAVTESKEEHDRRHIREKKYGEHFYRHKIADPGTKEVNGQAETTLITFVDGVTVIQPNQVPDPPGLPVSCTAVVVATVLGGKSHVSEDRDFVYSDYRVKIDQVLKYDAEKGLSLGEKITAWVRGGSVRFPSGHIKHFVLAGKGFPEVGTQYVLFLGRDDPKLDEYELWEAYALKDGVVRPLNDGNERFDGVKADEFLATLQEAVKARKAGN